MINNNNLMISWLYLFMVVPASTLQANHFQLLIWSGTLPKHRFYRYILPQTSFSLSGLSVLATCHSYPSLSQLVPRDATECRHLPCNVSMETLRSQKLGWCGACDFSSDWNPLENILKTSTNLHLHQLLVHAPNICLQLSETNPVFACVGSVLGHHGTLLTYGFVTNHPVKCGTNDTQQSCCISWSTGQSIHGWCWEMPGIRRWHDGVVNPRAAAQTPHRPSTWRYSWYKYSDYCPWRHDSSYPENIMKCKVIKKLY